MSLKIEALTSPRILGEGPHWDFQSKNLYFVDDFNSSIHRYNPSTKKETFCKVDKNEPVSIVIPMKDFWNKFAVTIGKKLAIVTWDGESEEPEKIEIIKQVDQELGKENNQFNDGKVDPAGRLWIGTMGAINADGSWTPEKGSLFCFPKNGNPIKHLENLSIANGLTWNKNQTKMFYIDSPTQRVDVFDFDTKLGKICNRKTFFDVKPHITVAEGGPDGMTIDDNDNLWFAVFGQGIIININGITGDVIRKIELPVKNPTSVAFGGDNLNELYITSATFGLSEEEKKLYPNSGCTLRVTGLGVKGTAAIPANL